MALVLLVPIPCRVAYADSPTAVIGLHWESDASGAVAITITTNADLSAGSYRSYTVPSPPRIVVVIRGISQPLQPATYQVGGRFLDRIRSGLHAERSPPELHLVFDVTDDNVKVLELGHSGPDLRVVVGPPRPRPIPTPAPTRTPTPTVEAPRPPVEPTIIAMPTPFQPSTESLTPRVISLTANPRGDASTLVLVTADGPLPEGCARIMEVAGDRARIILTLVGVSAPDLPRTLELGDPVVERVRLIHDAETAAGELHLVFYLRDPDVTVSDINQVGANLVLRLVAPTLR